MPTNLPMRQGDGGRCTSRQNPPGRDSGDEFARELVPRAGHGFATVVERVVGDGFANREGDAGLG